MRATRELPPGYRLKRVFSLDQTLTLLVLNVWGFLLLAGAAYVYIALFAALRPEAAPQALDFRVEGGPGVLRVIVALLAVMVGMIVVHEGIHGFFFWWYLRIRPKFAFKGAYAYAAAPGWYIPRNQYAVIGLAPLVLIGLACLLLIPVMPPGWFGPLLLLFSMNTSGAIGDLWMVQGLLRSPAGTLAFDEGDKTTLYVPEGVA
jgi:hypothetical protein